MKISYRVDEIIATTLNVLSGFNALQPSLNLPASADDMLAKALSLLREKEQQFQSSRALRAGKLLPALQQANTEAGACIDLVKKALRLKIGEKWSPVWAEAGFVDRTTSTPQGMAQREALLGALAIFVAARPELEDKALGGITSGAILARATALTRARSELDLHDSRHTLLSQERENLAGQVRRRLRSLLNELKAELADDDARWKAFGLESPATERALRPGRTERAQSQVRQRAAKKAQQAQEKAEKAQQRIVKAKEQAELAIQAADEAKRNAAQEGSSSISVMAA